MSGYGREYGYQKTETDTQNGECGLWAHRFKPFSICRLTFFIGHFRALKYADKLEVSYDSETSRLETTSHMKPESAENYQSDDKNSQSLADKLEERLVDFAVRIVGLSASLPRTAAGKHIATQILRSGESPAPNYGEARGAESHADFVHKLRIVLKELNETSIWLRILKRSHIMRTELLASIIEENRHLCRIFTA